jgi:hypothetical protein
MEKISFLDFPKNFPSSEGSYIILLWTGRVTTDRWVFQRWSLHRPAAVIGFAVIPEVKKEDFDLRERLLTLHEDEEKEELEKIFKTV